MQRSNVTLVAGPPGAGKTTWIQQQLAAIAQPAVYLGLGLGSVPIDVAYLAAETPKLTALADDRATELLNYLDAGYPIYIELGFHLDLASLILPIDPTNCHRVAVVPVNSESTEWHEWAEVIAEGSASQICLQRPQLWRSPLTGEVFDPASLNVFWEELTLGAYGNIQRAKGLFNLADGRSFYFNFVAGCLTEYIELKLPAWTSGRSDRLGGLEVLGEKLDEQSIAQTLEDCCLDDLALEYYQQQLQDALVTAEEAQQS